MASTDDELAERLPAEAARAGLNADDPVDAPPAAVRRERGFVKLDASRSGRGASDADEMLAEGFGRS